MFILLYIKLKTRNVMLFNKFIIKLKYKFKIIFCDIIYYFLKNYINLRFN